MSAVILPALPARDLLADRCRETAAEEGVQPFVVEKDFYLTRLLWALAQALGDQLLLKGGTLLSKVDLGFQRMSEDADFVIPGHPSPRKRDNAVRVNKVRDALRSLASSVGVTYRFPDGDRSNRDAHAIWELRYPSEFGAQGILLEVSIRPTMRQARRAKLRQLLNDTIVGDNTHAFCWALDPGEARAEKVRAALTREAARDFFDLGQLIDAGADLSSPAFIELVDAKLAEPDGPPLRELPRDLGLTGVRRARLLQSIAGDLPAMLRVNAPPFNLDATVARIAVALGRGRA